MAEAKRRNPRTDPSIFDFVGDTLLMRDELSSVSKELRLRFIARFQQTTGPVMAKGTEDTAFYQYNRLVSLNEVGGRPDTVRSLADGVPPPQRRPRTRLAGDAAGHLDARHQAQRGRPRAHQRPVGAAARLAQRR